MALENCKAAVSASLGRDLTKEEEAYITRNALKFKKRIDAANGNPDLIASIMQEAGERGDSVVARAQRDAALQWRALQTLEAKRGSIGFAKQNPAQWLKGLFRGNQFNYEGARNSLAVDVQREGNTRSEALETELKAGGLHEIADSRDMAVKTAINNALHELRNGGDVATVTQKYGLAGKVADVFNRHGEDLRLGLNREGAWIGENSDRTFRRTHDANKIAKAGGFDYGSMEAKDFWANEQSVRMDWDKAYDGEYADASEAERHKFLVKQAGEHMSGQHIDFTKDFGQGAQSGRIGQRFSHQRKLVFKSPADDLAYNEQYGRGSTLLENKLNELREGGKVMALMRRLGPRPEETIRKFTARWVDELNESDPVKAKALADQLHSEMNNTWRLLTGQVGHPSDNFVARSLAAVRHTVAVAKTGLSIFSLPNDMALRASMMGQFSSEFVQRSVTKQMAEFTKAAANLSTEDKRWLMSQLGSRWEDATRPMDPNLIDHPGFGALYKFNGMVSKSYGHGWWDNNFRTGAMANDGNIFAREMDQPFSKMSLKNAMERFGITAKEWDVLRTLDTAQLSDGRKVLMPMHIGDAELVKFKGIVGKADASNSLLAHARDDLTAKYRNMLGEMADRSTSATSIENQANLGLGTINANSAKAEAVKWLMQLKGWGVNYIRNHLDRELRGYSQDYVSVGHAMRDMMLGRNNKALLGMSRLIGKGMAIAYVTNALRDLATGKTPQNPFDFTTGSEKGILNTPGASVQMRAFARQGLGLYSDWLFHTGKEDERFSDKVLEAAGPIPETIGDLYDLGHDVVKQNSRDKFDDAAQAKDLQRLGGIGWRMIPGTQAWYSKAGMDAMIYNQVSESLNPGYKDRLQKRAADSGQTYWNGP